MGGFKFTPKKTGLAALLEEQERARAAEAKLQTITKPQSKQEEARQLHGFVEPEAAQERIRIIFDDSASMSGQKIKDARNGCIEFLRYCGVNQVACAVHPMNKEALALDTNLPDLAALINHIEAAGGTPMFTTLSKAQKEEIRATRFIVFSDGKPTDRGHTYGASEIDWMEKCILQAIEEKTPIDTVYICDSKPLEHEIAIMKELAERTGGIFLTFDRNKVNFGQAFKYLSPGLRWMLESDTTRKNLESGGLK